MAAASTIDSKKILGRAPERLTLEEQQALTGKFIALEIYSPATLPLRRIEALTGMGHKDLAADGARRLLARLDRGPGLDPGALDAPRFPPA